MGRYGYYVVFEGRAPGVYANWPEAEAQVKGFPRCCYKGFKSENEAQEALGRYRRNEPSSETAPVEEEEEEEEAIPLPTSQSSTSSAASTETTADDNTSRAFQPTKAAGTQTISKVPAATAEQGKNLNTDTTTQTSLPRKKGNWKKRGGFKKQNTTTDLSRLTLEFRSVRI